ARKADGAVDGDRVAAEIAELLSREAGELVERRLREREGPRPGADADRCRPHRRKDQEPGAGDRPGRAAERQRIGLDLELVGAEAQRRGAALNEGVARAS